jgi:two-component system cell cycle response regulator DivK
LTANVMRGDREKSLEAGCDGYIQKPIDIDTIVSNIERYLRKR